MDQKTRFAIARSLLKAASTLEARAKVRAADADTDMKVGDKVRFTAQFLKSTGQHSGKDANSTWTVKGIDGNFVIVDEPAYVGYFTAEELKKDPSLKWRRIAKANLMKAGKLDTTAL